MKRNIMKKIITSTPVYIMPPKKGEFTESNPRLTPYITDDGEIWLHAEGDGCGDDEVLLDLDGMTDDEVWETYCEFDVNAMRKDADEIAAAGDADNAEWLRDWCDRAERVQKGREVDAETLENALHELRENGYAADAAAIDSIREVWSDTRSSATIYRTDMGVYLMTSDGVPMFFDGVAAARAQIAQ